ECPTEQCRLDRAVHDAVSLSYFGLSARGPLQVHINRWIHLSQRWCGPQLRRRFLRAGRLRDRECRRRSAERRTGVADVLLCWELGMLWLASVLSGVNRRTYLGQRVRCAAEQWGGIVHTSQSTIWSAVACRGGDGS